MKFRKKVGLSSMELKEAKEIWKLLLYYNTVIIKDKMIDIIDNRTGTVTRISV